MTLFWAGNKSASLLWFIRICQKMCCFYQYYYTCINKSKIKRKPGTSWQRDLYLWVLNAAVYLRDINTQFVWFYSAKLLRTLSQFWRKRFLLKNIFKFAWTSSDRLRDWIITSGTLCSLPYAAILALNLYAYVNFNDLLKKRFGFSRT